MLSVFGVAEDIDLSGLTGRTVEQLSAGLGRIEMGFDDEWQISIECSWTLTAETGRPTAATRDTLLDHADALKRLIGARVIAAEAQAPDRVIIDFGPKGRLELIDDSDQLESFSIEPIGVIV